ncbi:uncharacterized protein [Haliotis cracherodii]|uniref:uncharacterized protein isoform X2 n=1 Tax=Haliotis cracherodii TaxID=6455 RepID=UPI0039E802A7
MASLGVRGSTEESAQEGGSDILARYQDRIKRGVTFTETERTVWGSDVYPSSRERSGWGSDVCSSGVRRDRGLEYTIIPTGRHYREKRRDVFDRGTTSIYTPERRKQIETMELKGSNVTDSNFRLPRIVVRDVVGRELDTFTTLQEAIYRAQWNVRTTCESRSPREWRLPKAPLPSRPDYSRQVPQNSTTRPEYRRTPRVAQSAPPGSVVEIGVEDVSFVAESLRQLPRLSAFHNLYSQIGGGSDRIYFHIVARLLLHQKVFPADDKREALYEFPGFCKGCRRAGFCYGCNKGTTFHIHHDQPVKTGGGYTYWKRDRPEGEDESKHPSSWMPRIPEEELRLLLECKEDEAYGSDHAMSQAAKDALWTRLIAHYPWLYDIPLNELTLEKMKELGLVSPAAGDEVGEEGGDEVYKPSMVEIPEVDTDSDAMSYTRLEKILQTRDATRKKYTFKLKKKVKKEESVPMEPTTRQTTQTISRPDTDRLRGWDSDSMYETSNIADSDKEEDTTETDSKKQSLYKAPRFFKVKKKQRQAIMSRSPFSTDRQYDIPKGRPLDIKKGTKSTTEFMDFKKSAPNWKAPRKFELQQTEKKSTSFWQPRSGGGRGQNKGQGQEDEANLSVLERKRRELERSLSPDSGLDSEVVTESLKESTEDNFRDSTQQNTETDLELPNLGQDQQYDSGKEASTTESPRQSLSPESPKKQRSAIVKKERSPIQFTRRKSSPEVTPEVTPEPEETKSVDDWSPIPPSRERTLTPPPQEEYVPTTSMPDLPQYRQEQKEGKKSKAQRFFVEGPPEMKTPQKKRKAAPKVRRLPKMHYRKKSRPAEAPMSAGALQEISDPLDFLAKYCIINPNRLPFYEVIFENMVTDQTPRYELLQAASEPVEREVTEGVKDKEKVKAKGKKSSKKTEEEGLSEHELKLARDMLLINHGQGITSSIGQNAPEEYREKIVYTLETLQEKARGLETQLTQLDMRRVSTLAESTRTLLPDVCAHDYVPPDKKKGKKGKKSKKDKEMEMVTPRRRGEPIPDEVIVERLTDAQLTMLSSDPEVRQLNLEGERTREKIHDVHNRLHQLEGEKLLLDILSNEVFFTSQADNQRSSGFRRQQSQLYNKLHPDPDYEMNLELVEEALQQINNHLLTDQEFKYLYFILDLPGRSKINFRLFSVIAALSEKVTQMDPVLRNLLNKFDYNALDVKMEKCKELFSLLKDDDIGTPAGGAPASTLALELTAGGLRPEHISYVLSKFNREGKGMFDFMDFVTYIPLFIEIHQRIVKDPLCVEQTI